MNVRASAAAIAVFAAMVLPAGAGAIAGPQPLPDAACNQGTQNARNNVGPGAYERISHHHDFDADGTPGCYHFNPAISERGE